MNIEKHRTDFPTSEAAHAYLRGLKPERRKIHRTAVIEKPFVKIGKNVNVGAYSVIGGIGFGVEPIKDRLEMVNHIGAVIIYDNVYIKSHVAIDRAKLKATVIGYGTMIDNLVHVGHNAFIGSNCEIVAGSVIGGSVNLGDNVFVGEGVRIKNHVKIGKNVIIGQGANVLKDVPDNVVIVGNPGRVLRQVDAGKDPLPLRRLI